MKKKRTRHIAKNVTQSQADTIYSEDARNQLNSYPRNALLEHHPLIATKNCWLPSFGIARINIPVAVLYLWRAVPQSRDPL